MTDLINETINPKQAVLFFCGGINEIAQQFITMLDYCRKKHMHVIEFFFDTSNIPNYEKECYNNLLDFIEHISTKTAVVFYDNKSFHKYANTDDFLHFTTTKKIELHLAKNRIILSNRE